MTWFPAVGLFFEGRRVTTSVIELKCNWGSLKNWGTQSRFPTGTTFDNGDGPSDELTSIFLPLKNRADIEIADLRDWLVAMAGKRFSIWGRFAIEHNTYRIDRDFLGATFRFENQDEAVLFKLFWV